MDKLTSSKLELALITPDAIDVWNIVVRARGLYFKLSYLTHHPTLYVGTKDGVFEPWMVIDTRRKMIMKLPIRDKNVFDGLRDMEDRLLNIGLKLTLRYDVKSQQKFVSMRFISTTGGPMTTVLDRIKKGQSREYHDFKLNERW